MLAYVRTIATNIKGFWDLGELADGVESRLAASSRGTPKSLRLEIRTESQRNSQQGRGADTSTLAKRFPIMEIKTLEDGSQLAPQGVGEGPTTSKYVDIPIRCKTAEHEMVEFLAIRVHIVDRLPEGIFLLGLNFIIPNALDFRWGRNGSPLHRLQIGDMDSYIPLRTKITKETENPRPVAVYLTVTIVLQPGQGQNLPIRYRTLPPTKNGYL